MQRKNVIKKKLERKKKKQDASTEDEGLLSSFLSVNWFGSKQEQLPIPKSPSKKVIEDEIDLKKQILEQEKEDMDYLKEMFPQFDDSILKDVYYSKDKNIPLTIESLLELV